MSAPSYDDKKRLLGKRCQSSDYFKAQFPRTIRRNKGVPLSGLIIDELETDYVAVKWDTLKTPWKLVTAFLIVEQEPPHDPR